MSSLLLPCDCPVPQPALGGIPVQGVSPISTDNTMFPPDVNAGIQQSDQLMEPAPPPFRPEPYVPWTKSLTYRLRKDKGCCDLPHDPHCDCTCDPTIPPFLKPAPMITTFGDTPTTVEIPNPMDMPLFPDRVPKPDEMNWRDAYEKGGGKDYSTKETWKEGSTAPGPLPDDHPSIKLGEPHTKPGSG
eukprot:TRINITY_DN40909_c0_g1_i1.p1 TRINITY_DN40909_c0_g1~~TRINITY_DN40909_c0_g1_i1.p1  ORF type:complete len:219 (+),score=41.48 TRINITY_DN40909_c0_g1_i1:99-659(+)